MISRAEKDIGRSVESIARTGAGLAQQAARKAAIKQAGKGLSALFRLIASLLGPYLWITIALVLAIALMFSLTMGIFGVMAAGSDRTHSQVGLFTGVIESPADLTVQSEYQKLADKVSYQDLRLAAEDNSWMVVQDGQQPEYPENPLHPGSITAQKLVRIQSYYQQEKYLPWGMIHSVRLWWAFLKNDNALLDNLHNMKNEGGFDAIEQNIPGEVRASTVAGALHPYFYYIPATFVTRYIPPPGAQNTAPSSEVEHVYLLVEANTIDGWRQYSYKRVHEDKIYPNGSRVIRDYCARYGERLVVPDRYHRIRNYLSNLYGMDPGDQQTELMRLNVMEAGEGFVKHEQHVDWLTANFNPSTFTSAGMVPAEYKIYFQEAEQRFGIPAWFLEAVAMKESSFDPASDNGKAGDASCYGLMQVSADNWSRYAAQLDFSPAMDKENPRAQILVGSFLLKIYLGAVDWKMPDWQEQTLTGLAWYGGFRNARNQVDQEAIDRCHREYASVIWKFAEGFKDHDDYCWPVIGPHVVTSPYNLTDATERIHKGVDIAAQMGDAVYSVAGGYVEDIEYGDPIYGNFVVVSDTVHSYKYAHLGNVQVRLNEPAEAGVTTIGQVGMTGKTTGPHVHLEIRYLSTGAFINPLDIIGYDCIIEH